MTEPVGLQKIWDVTSEYTYDSMKVVKRSGYRWSLWRLLLSLKPTMTRKVKKISRMDVPVTHWPRILCSL